MMKIIWGLIGIGIVGLIAAILVWGVGPRAIKLIDPSGFQEPSQMGTAIYNRLRQEVIDAPVVVMGGNPQVPAHTQLALGFLERARADGHPFQGVISEPGTLPKMADVEQREMDLNSDIDRIATVIRGLSSQQKLFIYTVNIYSSHLLDGNPMLRLEQTLGRKLMAFSLLGLAVNAGELGHLEPPCRGLALDTSGTASLGCVAATRSRAVFRKHLDVSKYLLVLDQEGADDYLALVRVPAP